MPNALPGFAGRPCSGRAEPARSAKRPSAARKPDAQKRALAQKNTDPPKSPKSALIYITSGAATTCPGCAKRMSRAAAPANRDFVWSARADAGKTQAAALARPAAPVDRVALNLAVVRPGLEEGALRNWGAHVAAMLRARATKGPDVCA